MSAQTQAALHEAIAAHLADEGWTYDGLRGVHLAVIADGLTRDGDESAYWGSRLVYHNADSDRTHFALAAPDHVRGTMDAPEIRSYPFPPQ